MTNKTKPNLVEDFFERMRRNKVTSIAIILGVIVMALANLTDSLTTLVSFFRSQPTSAINIPPDTSHIKPQQAPLIFNNSNHDSTLKIIFTSKLLSLTDTLLIPQELTPVRLMDNIIKNYGLRKEVMKKEDFPDNILWALIHENKKIDKKNMKKSLDSLHWKQFDRISLEYTAISTGNSSPRPHFNEGNN